MPKIHHDIPDNIAAILRKAKIDGCKLRMEDLAPEDYKGAKKFIELSGGKWNRSADAHVFPEGGIENMLAALDAGTATDRVAEHQSFYTPHGIARDLLKLAMMGRRKHERLLEPSAGDGALADAALANDPTAKIVCVEIRPEACLALRKANHDVRQGDFLLMEPRFIGSFDVIVMNPPFTKDADLRHIMHAWSFLNPGGTLAALCSPGFTAGLRRGLKRQFNDFLLQHGAEHELLPSAQFGRTKISVVRILIRKPAAVLVTVPAPLRPLNNAAARRLAAL